MSKPPATKDDSYWAFSDAGNAACFRRLCGHCLRYVAERNLWRVWSGRHWADDLTGQAYHLTLRVLRHRLDAVPALTNRREQVAESRWVTLSGSVRRRRALLEAASTLPGFASRLHDYDRDPLTLNCLNGALDLRTGQLRPHEPEDMIAKLAPVEYHPDAPCPRWEQFLHEIFQGNQELIAFAARLVGYLLTGDTSEQAAFFLVGKGANGKSVFVETLRALLGDYAGDLPASVFSDSRQFADFAPLVGARAVTVSEGDASRVLNDALFKSLTGGDLLTCRPRYRDGFSYTPALKLLFVTNDFPRFASHTHALLRRVRLLPFHQTFYAQEENREPRRDQGLSGKLREEPPGILAWAVRGCQEWLRGGLRPPSIVMQETALQLAARDPLSEFLQTECLWDPQSQVSTSRLWQAYLCWCACHQRPPAFQSATGFTRNLAQRDGLDLARRHHGRYLVGLELRPQTEFAHPSPEPSGDSANVH